MTLENEAQCASYRVPTCTEIKDFCSVLSCAAAAGVLYYRPEGMRKLFLVRKIHLSIITSGIVVVVPEMLRGIIVADFALTSEMFVGLGEGKPPHVFIPEWLGGSH